jgi:hypothetical protein
MDRDSRETGMLAAHGSRAAPTAVDLTLDVVRAPGIDADAALPGQGASLSALETSLPPPPEPGHQPSTPLVTVVAHEATPRRFHVPTMRPRQQPRRQRT